MKLEITQDEERLEFDLQNGCDISIPIKREQSVSSFQIAAAVYKNYTDGSFIGNKNKGGSCNLETISFTAHGNGTHTEAVGHISLEKHYVNDLIKDSFYLARLLSLSSLEQDDNLYLDFSKVDFNVLDAVDALVIRSLPNTVDKKHKDYSGQITACISPADMKKIVNAGIKHLLVDLPSVDPEWDGGLLSSHHIFWNYPDKPRMDASITEFTFVPDSLKDGVYALQLNISNFISDAAPSKPTLYPLI